MQQGKEGCSGCKSAADQISFKAEHSQWSVEQAVFTSKRRGGRVLILRTTAPSRMVASASGNSTTLSMLCLCTGNKVKRLPGDATLRTELHSEIQEHKCKQYSVECAVFMCRQQGKEAGCGRHSAHSCPLPEDPPGPSRARGANAPQSVCGEVRHAQQAAGTQSRSPGHLRCGCLGQHGAQQDVICQGG